MKIISNFFDFIVPRSCISCMEKLSDKEQFICESCFSQIDELSPSEIKNEYKRKFSNTAFVDDYTSLFNFKEHGKIQDLIHELKYNQKFNIGIFLGKIVGDKKKELIKSWEINTIIPIPLFHLKKVDRGYNQADYIGKGLAKCLGIKVYSSIVKRVKNTQSQTKLDTDNRIANMSNAFIVKKSKKVSGKNILIVDDVITTGTTVLELAKVLKENGAAKVYCLSIATPLISHTIGSSNTQN